MRPINGFDKVQASGEYERLAPGGYVIKIQSVTDDAKKEYLKVVYDIAEGSEAGRYKNEMPENDYRHSFIRSYKEKALGMLKAFTNAIEESNPGYKWDWNERALSGKILGIVFGYEEYEANDGSIKERLYVRSCMSADRIRQGDYKVPELKKLKPSKSADPAAGIPEGFMSVIDDSELPF